MIIFITSLLSITIVLMVISEISSFSVYGKFVSKEVEDIYMKLDESKLRLNSLNPQILSTTYFIAPIPFGILCKYYINGIGSVPRWSRLHKRITQYYVIALKNEIEKL